MKAWLIRQSENGEVMDRVEITESMRDIEACQPSTTGVREGYFLTKEELQEMWDGAISAVDRYGEVNENLDDFLKAKGWNK